MHRVPALSVVLAALFVVAVGPASAADTSDGRAYTFPATCDGDSIYTSDTECVDGTILIDLHDDGTATWVSETAYPRAAFDAYLTEHEEWTDSTQAYMDQQLADMGDDATAEATVTDSLVLVDLTYELSGDNAYARGFALAADDQLYVAISADDVDDVSLVRLTAPGTIQVANGSVDGTTVTWDEATLDGIDELQVNALTHVESDRSVPLWVLVTGAALLVLTAIAGYLGFARPKS